MKRLSTITLALLITLTAYAQVPSGYTAKGSGQMKYGFATEGDYTIIGEDGKKYRAVIIHPEKDMNASVWYFEDDTGKAIKSSALAASLYKAATIAHLNRKGLLLSEIKETKGMLTKSLTGIGAYTAGKFVTEVGSKAEGMLVKLMATGDSSAVIPAARRLVVSDIAKEMADPDLVVKGTIQLAATMKSFYAAFAKAAIAESADGLSKALDIASATKGPWKASDGAAVYDAWKKATVEGLPAIVLWNEMCDTGGLFGTIKTIFANFFEGATEIKIGYAFDMMENFEATHDDFFVKANKKYDDLRKGFSEAYRYYEEGVKRLGGMTFVYDPTKNVSQIFDHLPRSVKERRLFGNLKTMYVMDGIDISETYSFSESGMEVKYVSEHSKRTSWPDTYTFSYDQNDGLTYIDVSKKGKQDSYFEVDTTPSSMTLYIHNNDYRDIPWTGKRLYRFDEKGRTVFWEDSTITDRSGRNFRPVLTYTVEYGEREITYKGYYVEKIILGENGLPERISYYAYDGNLAMKENFTYDDYGNVLTEFTENLMTKTTTRRKYEYEYDAEGNWGYRKAYLEETKFGVTGYNLKSEDYRRFEYYSPRVGASEKPQTKQEIESSTAPKADYPVGTVYNLAGPDDHLNVRSEPSVKGKILLKLGDKVEVSILGKTADPKDLWYKVDAGGTIGYCSADYLKVSSGDAAKIQVVN